eukprot:TRINITY_DN5771_c0_g1_i1.p1 TRINITY_DN5771_c0_g1~~TRINITY_DN5771_c0_g1_i1.p1  ORF type:complete len:888 (-),score=165.51 TRINITY_DN5771_c0_g1_i1:813-3386(-)
MYVMKPVNPVMWNPGLVYRVPDVVDGEFAGNYFSFPVVNFNVVYAKGVNVTAAVKSQEFDQQFSNDRQSDYMGPEEIIQIQEQADLVSEFVQTVVIQPGQAAPLPIYISNKKLESCAMGQKRVIITFTVCFEFGGEESSACLEHDMEVVCKNFGESYTFTFLDVDKSVQYSAVTPPTNPCSPLPSALQDMTQFQNFLQYDELLQLNTGFEDWMNVYKYGYSGEGQGFEQMRKLLGENDSGDELNKCTIMFNTHGAGVDASNPGWAPGSYIQQQAAWQLYPTNRGMFAYNWQELGRLNSLQALDVFVKQLPGVPAVLKKYYGADDYNILFTGHSMGGHGCLVFSTHETDRSIGSACAAAWIRSDDYVQEYQRPGYSFADTVLEGLLKSAASQTYTDLQAVNMKGLPFLGRMGDEDNNVCPWNLRRFARVLDEINGQTGYTTISEVPGKPHWWGNVMKDATMNQYYAKVINAGKPPLPNSFRVASLDLSAQGRGGVRILQQHSSHIMSTIDVSIESDTWKLSTTNVRRFTLVQVPHLQTPVLTHVEIDETNLHSLFQNSNPTAHYCQDSPFDDWKICDDATWKQFEREANSNGPLSQVFNGQLVIIYGTKNLKSFQVSNRDQESQIMYGFGSPLRDQAIRIANSHFWKGHAQPLVLSDEQASTRFKTETQTRNILLLGGPYFNSFSENILNQTTLQKAFTFQNNQSKFSVGKLKFNKPGIGIAAFGRLQALSSDENSKFDGFSSKIYKQQLGNTIAGAQQIKKSENNDKKEQQNVSFDMKSEGGEYGQQLVVLVSGTDLQGMVLAVDSVPIGGTPEIPDFVVVGSDSKWMGEGGILATGYLGNKWEIRYDLMYPRLPVT